MDERSSYEVHSRILCNVSPVVVVSKLSPPDKSSRRMLETGVYHRSPFTQASYSAVSSNRATVAQKGSRII